MLRNQNERHSPFPLLTWAAHKLSSRGMDTRAANMIPLESENPMEPILNSFSCLAVSGSDESDFSWLTR